MVTVHGISKKEGIAVAVAAVVDATLGVSGVSPDLLAEGLASIREGVPPSEYPEAIVVCDKLAVGALVRIPGVNTIAIAAESDADAAGLEPEAPCVIGASGMLQAVSHGDILIVDGNKGVVHIDPDVQTLIHYQEIEERHAARTPVFIESEHIQARTQGGEVVTVYACLEDAAEVGKALDEGADGLLVRVTAEAGSGFYEAVLSGAAGKPVVFEAEFAELDLLRAVMRFASPGQVSVVLPAEAIDDRLEEAATALESAATEAFLDDLDPPKVAFGVIARDGQEISGEPEIVVVDARQSAPAEASAGAMLLLGESMDAVPALVEAGARWLAVPPKLVSACKYTIRSIGSEEIE